MLSKTQYARSHLLIELVQRDFRQRYMGNVAGAFWALLQPILLLAVYAFAFTKIMAIRLPGDVPGGFVGFLAVALWPWLAFSEGVLRGTTAIQDNAALISKIAVDRVILVYAPVVAGFLVNLIGYLAVLILLRLIGFEIDLVWLPAVLLVWIALAFLAGGIALGLSAIHVFARDTAQLLAQVLTLLFFMTPIIYSIELIPESYLPWMELNPITGYIGLFRYLLLDQALPNVNSLYAAGIATVVACLVGRLVFNRLTRHFEDFL